MATSAAFAGDVRIMWYSDGVEGEVIKDILDRFQKDNPDIKITLDNVAYKVVQEQLPISSKRAGARHRARHQHQGTGQSLARPAPAC
jgi:ABC-type glycerol-3-phosphate transport system substrate-binding protein